MAGLAAGSAAASPGPPHVPPPKGGRQRRGAAPPGPRRHGRRARASGPGRSQPPSFLLSPGPAPVPPPQGARAEKRRRPASLEQNTIVRSAIPAHAHTDCLASHARLVSTASAPTAQARPIRPYSATAHPCSPRLSGGKILEGVLAKPPRHDALPFRVLRSAPPTPLSCAHAPRALFPWQLRLFSAKPPARSWGGGARREEETTGGGRQGTRRLPAAPPRKRTGPT